ncbi:hypothetical protein N7457_001402 [Penicillium paradoxum]|uniref:uncharacterized protein n=1 Tax=Penicillium paradoxum TaxID=176176 RepID=UPI0025498D6D|nr:uncharacterized protein N7457_001402 [Penicillium paradoxum]KAJ5794803.1 hypothetical protein N7457_001402 [Penicillium paradoxum]
MWPCLEAMQMLAFPPSLITERLVSHRGINLGTRYFQHCWVACGLILLIYNIGVYDINTIEEDRAQTITVINDLSSQFWIHDLIVEQDDFPPSPNLHLFLESTVPCMLPLYLFLLLLQYLGLSHGSECRREVSVDAHLHLHYEEFGLDAPFDMEDRNKDMPSKPIFQIYRVSWLSQMKWRQ